MDNAYKRINITIGEAQYLHLSEKNINISGLIRDLLGDHLSHSAITIQVTEQTRHLYDTIISNTGATDADIETHLRTALAKVLEERIASMRDLHARLTTDSEAGLLTQEQDLEFGTES